MEKLTIETMERKEKGKNCRLKITFLRHAHKAQMNPHSGGAISQSSLSKKGELASQNLGRERKTEPNLKSYVSTLERSQQTAENFLLGEMEKKDAPNIMKTRIRSEINAPHFSPEFIKVYRSHFIPKPENFAALSADEQEKIIEDMEAPAVDYWIDLWDKKFDEETESAKEIAERVAYYFSKFDKMIERLNSGSEVELLNVTHKTTTEPFLKACLKPSISNFKEVGGPLELLEDFEIIISTDNSGRKNYKVLFRDKEYEIDLDKVAELSNDYLEKKKNSDAKQDNSV